MFFKNLLALIFFELVSRLGFFYFLLCRFWNNKIIHTYFLSYYPYIKKNLPLTEWKFRFSKSGNIINYLEIIYEYQQFEIANKKDNKVFLHVSFKFNFP